MDIVGSALGPGTTPGRGRRVMTDLDSQVISMKIRVAEFVVPLIAASMLLGAGRVPRAGADDWPPKDFSPPKPDWSTIGKPVTYVVPRGLTTPESLRFDKPFQQGPRCGLNGLFAMLKICGKDVTYEDVQRRVRLGPDGADLEGLREAASAFGLHTEVRRVTPEELRVAPKPILVHIDTPATGAGKGGEGSGHFTVVTSVDPDGMLQGIDTTNALFTSWRPDTISRDATGYCLVLEGAPRAWLLSPQGLLIAGHFALILVLNLVVMARLHRRDSHAPSIAVAS